MSRVPVEVDSKKAAVVADDRVREQTGPFMSFRYASTEIPACGSRAAVRSRRR